MEGTASDVPNLTVRLIGEVRVDETTGATTAVFDDVPAIPVTEFKVTFRGGHGPGARAPAPVRHGRRHRRIHARQRDRHAEPLGEPAAEHRLPDANAFAPTMQLDRSTTAAGQSMTFTTTVDVPAKSQELSKLALHLPAGLLGQISSVPACSLSDAKAGAAPPARRSQR